MCATLQILSARSRDIAKAAALVKKGGILAYPTDTVYGLGCDPHNPQALKKAMAIKGRRKKPFPILVASPGLADGIAVMDPQAKALASEFWPGPLTLVLRPRIRFPNQLTLGQRTIAVRCPKSPIALKLIRKCGGFLTGTSANLTGQPPCTSAQMVRRSLADLVDAVLDGGPSPRRTGSTIVRIDSRGVIILRKGPIRSEQVKRALSRASPLCKRR
jgi:L-threonylcarbamoyladenylate synthase